MDKETDTFGSGANSVTKRLGGVSWVVSIPELIAAWRASDMFGLVRKGAKGMKNGGGGCRVCKWVSRRTDRRVRVKAWGISKTVGANGEWDRRAWDDMRSMRSAGMMYDILRESKRRHGGNGV